MATLVRLLLSLNGVAGPDYFQAGDSLIKPGYVVERDDADEVKIATTSAAAPLGVAGTLSWLDINTVYTIGWRVPV